MQPDYSITTAIDNVHIERFGSLENIKQAKLELANATKTMAVLNICDTNIKDAMQQYLHTQQITEICADTQTTNINYLPDFNGQEFDYKNLHLQTKLIAPYIPQLSALVIELATQLNIDEEKIKLGIKNIKQEPHRLEVLKNTQLNRTIIDDSYNGNERGFIAGIDILKRATGRKIVLTPGIVELGKKQKAIHTNIAKQYANNADFVMLIKNTQTTHIKNYFDQHGFTKYKMYDSAEDAHKDIANVLQSGDTIIFQNDLTDNYA